MHAQFISRLTVVVLFLLSIVAVQPVARVAAATPRSACSCVAYIAEQYNLSQTAHAKDMGAVLKNAGFRQLSGPAANAIVIIQPEAFTRQGGDGAVFGHIAIIVSYTIEGNTVKLVLRGANQYVPNVSWSQRLPASATCSNLSQTSYSAIESHHLSYFAPQSNQE